MRADWRTVARIVVAAVAVVFVVRFIAAQWDAIRLSAAQLHPNWAGLAFASLWVFAGYAALIAAWRMLLRLWRSPIALDAAVRIWFVSSLGKYVPGKVWAIGAMAVLAKEAGASPIAATGSSVIMQLVNIAAGFVVIAGAGAGAPDLYRAYPALRIAGWITIAVSLAGLVFGPQLVRVAARLAGRLTGRDVPAPPPISHAAVFLIFAANVLAWIAYGIGFGVFWSALLGHGGGISVGALAVYTASYLMGYLVLVAPGGFGVREAALTALLITLHLASPAEAALLAAASRVWITILEVLPGLALLPGTSLRRRSSISTPDGPPA